MLLATSLLLFVKLWMKLCSMMINTTLQNRRNTSLFSLITFLVRPPIDNEIPDSSNVQDSRDAGADVPLAVDGKPESRQAQLNLGEF